MPLVRSLIELHGGTLNVTSDVGNGTSVICSLPLNGHINAQIQKIDEIVEQPSSDHWKNVVNS